MICRHRAVLIITHEVEGTSTAIARERKNLSCGLHKGHAGPHRDQQFQEQWDDKGEQLTHILRDESEDF